MMIRTWLGVGLRMFRLYDVTRAACERHSTAEKYLSAAAETNQVPLEQATPLRVAHIRVVRSCLGNIQRRVLDELYSKRE